MGKKVIGQSEPCPPCNPEVTAQITETRSISCAGGGNGQLTLNSNYYSNDLIIIWQKNGNTVTAWNGLTVINNVSAGTYSVRVRVRQNDCLGIGNNCIALSDYTLSEPAAIDPGSISGDQTICSGDNPTNIQSTAAASGGTGGFSYQWQQDIGCSGGWSNIGGQTGLAFNPGPLTQTTCFRRRAINNNSCPPIVFTLPVQITVNNNPTAPNTPSASSTFVCSGTNITLSTSGGSGGTIKWYKNACGTGSGGTLLGTGTSINQIVNSNTTYYVRREGTCGLSPCRSITVNVKDAPVAPTSISATSLTICPGESTSLTLVGGTLGTGGSTYWKNGGCNGTTINIGSPTITVTPSSATTYYAQYVADCGTTSCVSTTINVKNESSTPSGISISTNPICPGNLTTLNVVGGYLGTSASWKWYSGSCGGTFVGTGSSLSVSPSSNTTYFVRAEGDCNNTPCRSETVTILSQSAPASSASASPSEICSGGSTTLSLAGGSLGDGASWKWYKGSCGGAQIGTGTSIIVSPSSTTNYYVRAEGTCNTTSCESVSVSLSSNSTAPTGISATINTICEGNSTTLSVNGGALGTGASWKWYKGSCNGTAVGSGNTINVSPSSTTTYYVRAEGSCNTTSCASTSITVRTNSVAPSSVNANPAIICLGGSSNLSLTGGSLGTGASWKWYKGNCGGTLVGNGTSAAVSPTVTTTYFVRAEGDCNNTTCKQVTVTVPTTSTAPTGITSSANLHCTGTSTTLSVNGGSLGTSASWKWYSGTCGGTAVGSGISVTVSPTTTTTYFVRAEDICNNTNCAFLTLPVKQSSTAPTSATANRSTICPGQSSELTVNSGTLGTNAFWEWYSGSCGGTPVGNGLTVDVSPTVTTTYFVRAEGDCNNTTCAKVTVNVKTESVAPTGITASKSNICYGEATKLTVQGGSLGTGATWQWYRNSCSGTAFQTGNPIWVKPDADRIFYVRAEGDCNTTSCVQIQIQVSPQLSVSPASTKAGCGRSDGEVSVNPTGGIQPYVYTWTDAGALIIGSKDTISNLPAGTYNVTVTDNFECTVDSSVTIHEHTSPVNISFTHQNQSCPGVADGHITANITGGVNHTYLWSPGGETTQTISNLTGGTYTVTVTDDGTGCSTTEKHTIIRSNSPVEVTIDALKPVTCPEVADGVLSANATGSSGYSYSWSPGGSTSPLLSGLGPGTYKIVVYDNIGCSDSAEAVIPVENGPSIDSVMSYSATCSRPDAMIKIFATGNALKYSIDSGRTYSSTNHFSNLGAGTYQPMIRDTISGCTDNYTDLVITTSTDSITVSIVDTTNPSACAVPNGSIEVSATGGTGKYYFELNPGGTVNASGIFNNLLADYYTVTVIDSNDATCLTPVDITLKNPGTPPNIYQLLSQKDLCAEGNGSILIFANGQTQLSYSIDGGTTFKPESLFTALPANTYHVIAQDTFKCQADSIIEIITPEMAVIDSITAADPQTCNINTGELTIHASGGTGNLAYSIDSGLTWQNKNHFTSLLVDKYEVLVRDTVSCEVYGGTVSLIELDKPQIINVSVTDGFCGEHSGSISISVSDGTGDFLYSIDNGSTYQQDSVFQNVESGIYMVTVKDQGNCKADSGLFTINTPDSITIKSLQLTLATNCTVDNGTIVVNATGGTGSLTYSIDGGTTYIPESSFDNLGTGSYSLVVMDSTGCTQDSLVLFPGSEDPVITGIDTTEISDCNATNGEAVITGTSNHGDLQYSIDNGTSFQDTNHFTGLIRAEYLVIIKDTLGCIDTSSFEIQSNSDLVITRIDTTSSICLQPVGSAAVKVSGGSPPYEYQWMPGDKTTDSIYELTPGKYIVSVTDQINCIQTDSVEIISINHDCLKIYSGITINGNGKNDYWHIDGIILFPDNQVTIFNRWGDVVWEAARYDNSEVVWAGENRNGQPLPVGTYYYVLKLPDGKHTGWVELMR